MHRVYLFDHCLITPIRFMLVIAMDDPDVEEGLVEQEERAEEGEDGDDGEDDKGKL